MELFSFLVLFCGGTNASPKIMPRLLSGLHSHRPDRLLSAFSKCHGSQSQNTISQVFFLPPQSLACDLNQVASLCRPRSSYTNLNHYGTTSCTPVSCTLACSRRTTGQPSEHWVYLLSGGERERHNSALTGSPRPHSGLDSTSSTPSHTLRITTTV